MWFYADSRGKVLRSCIKQIGKYTYAGTMEEFRLDIIEKFEEINLPINNKAIKVNNYLTIK